MSLLFKNDWAEVKERYKHWWKHEYFGRCATSLRAPTRNAHLFAEPVLPCKTEDRWTDIEYLCKLNEFRMQTTFFGGEALPVWNAGYPGWDTIQSYLGAPVDLKEHTGWVHPIVDKEFLEDYDFHQLKIEEENKWWKFSQNIHEIAVWESKGKSLPGIQDLGSSGDSIASLRGSEKLLIDLVECPDYVREFDQYLMKIWIEVYEKLYSVTKEGAEGSTHWFKIWAPGKSFPVQNDFSYMISPKMFIDIFIPTIEMQLEYLDYSVYHVDGAQAFVHVDALCDLPRLNALQILPGEGKPSPLCYMDVLKKVQAKGKNLHISLKTNEIETALSELSARGLFIDAFCESEEEAAYYLKMMSVWSKDRKMK